MSPITTKLKTEIVQKMQQGEDLQQLSTIFNVPMALLLEWQQHPPKNISTGNMLFEATLEQSGVDSLTGLKNLDSETIALANAIISVIKESDLTDPFTAKVLNIHADTVLKLRSAFLKGATGIGVPPDDSGLSMLNGSLKD